MRFTLAAPAALALAVLSAATFAQARDDGRYAEVDPDTKAWVRGLKDKLGVGCCDTADGYPAEAEWDTAADKYKVRIEGRWHVVPDRALITEPNRLGYAVVWYFKYEDGDVLIRCFIPGGGT